MHPEDEPPTIFAGDSEIATWWATVLMSDRRKKRIRRVVGDVLAFALTFTALTALWLVVNLIDS
jgi:hypothetical protein